MRLAIVSNLLPPAGTGGAETYAAQLAEDLAARHDVLLISATPSHRPGLEAVTVPALPELPASAPAPSKALWHGRDQWRPAVHRAALAALRRFAPEVVHTNNVQGLSAAPFTAVSRTAIPHVHTLHDFNALCVRTTMTRGDGFCGGRCRQCALQRGVRGRLLDRSLGWLVSPSRYVLERHLHAGVGDRARSSVLPQGAQPGRVRVRAGGPEGLTLGYLGALREHKGVLTLLDAFAKADPSWRLRLAGSGALEDEVRAASARDPRIELAGFVEGAEKDRFLDDLDLLVVPSEWEENAPLVITEAAVRALPAVVSDRGGLGESPGAWTFAAGNPRALLGRLEEISRGDALREASEALAQRGTEFLWRTHVARLEELLEARRA